MTMRSPLRRGHRGDADVDQLALDLLGDAAVLRQALLGDVQAGLDLHARHDRRHEALVRVLDRVELAVDAVADHDFLVGRLDVDVGRAVAHRLVEEVVDPADDRRFVGHVDEVLQLFFVLLFSTRRARSRPCARRRG